jgi:hypothetical protein
LGRGDDELMDAPEALRTACAIVENLPLDKATLSALIDGLDVYRDLPMLLEALASLFDALAKFHPDDAAQVIAQARAL